MSEYHQQKLIENITQNITKVISELINSIKEEQKKVIEHPHFKSYSSIRPDCTKIHELRNILKKVRNLKKKLLSDIQILQNKLLLKVQPLEV